MHDLQGFETTSGRPVPWRGRKVFLLRIAGVGGRIEQSGHSLTSKRAFLAACLDGDTVLCAWAGDWSGEFFVVDNLEEARFEIDRIGAAA